MISDSEKDKILNDFNATYLSYPKGKTIIEKYQFIIRESEIYNKGCSIFFCSLNADQGVCLWKGEYDSRFYVW